MVFDNRIAVGIMKRLGGYQKEKDQVDDTSHKLKALDHVMENQEEAGRKILLALENLLIK